MILRTLPALFALIQPYHEKGPWLSFKSYNLCNKPGVSNSRPLEPQNAARETILKFLMNFGSIATFHFRINVCFPEHRRHLRVTAHLFFLEIDFTWGSIGEIVTRRSGSLRIQNCMRLSALGISNILVQCGPQKPSSLTPLQ